MRQIELWQAARVVALQASDERLGQGFHAYEPDNGRRWTNGDAMLPATLFEGFDGSTHLTLHVAGRMQYPDYGVPQLDLAG